MKKFFVSFVTILLVCSGMNVLAQAEFTFSDVDCGDVDIREMGFGSFTLRNSGTEAGTIFSMSKPSNSSFKVIPFNQENEELINFPYTLQPNQEIEILIEFFPKDSGIFLDQIIFTSENGNHISNLRAHAVPSTLVFENTDFGNNYINEEKTLNVTLKNIGKKTYDIISISPKNKKSKFQGAAGHVKLLPGTSWGFPVRFLTDTFGIFTDSLQIVLSERDYYIQVSATVEEPSLGIERVYDPSFNISPNPATGFTTINLPSFKSQNPLLKVYDALGNEVVDISDKITEGENSHIRFSTLMLPNAIYFIRLTDGAQTFSRTLIVQN